MKKKKKKNKNNPLFSKKLINEFKQLHIEQKENKNSNLSDENKITTPSGYAEIIELFKKNSPDEKIRERYERDKRLQSLSNGIALIYELTRRANEIKQPIQTSINKSQNTDQQTFNEDTNNTNNNSTTIEEIGNEQQEKESNLFYDNEKGNFVAEEMVSDERYNNICLYFKQHIDQLKNIEQKDMQLRNITVPIIQKGIETVLYHLERGAITFDSYMKRMINDVGYFIVPFLRRFYEAAKNFDLIPNDKKAQMSSSFTINENLKTAKQQENTTTNADLNILDNKENDEKKIITNQV